MPMGCLAGTPSFLKQSPACALTLCGLIGYHLLLPAPAQETKQPAECPQPCCAYTLPAGAPSQSGDHFEMSSEK